MCCGQKRAQLTSNQISSPRTILSVSISTPGKVAARATYIPSAVPPAMPNAPPPSASSPATTLQNSATTVAPDCASIQLQYKEQSPIQVRGLATGHVYVFSGSQPVQVIDVRDAAALLQTRFFRRT